MGLVRRLRWSFVHMELIVDQCSQGHNLQRNNRNIRSLFHQVLKSQHKIPQLDSYKISSFTVNIFNSIFNCVYDLTSLWWVLGFCTVLRLMDMTVMGGGDRSLTTVTRSLLRAIASTLHQLTGWLISSDTDGVGNFKFKMMISR